MTKSSVLDSISSRLMLRKRNLTFINQKIDMKVNNSISTPIKRRKLSNRQNKINDDDDENKNDNNDNNDTIWYPLSRYIYPDNSHNDFVNKDQKINLINLENNDMVSSTTIKNHLLNDPILDWLDLYYMDYGLGGNELPVNTKNENKETIKQNINKNQTLLQNGLVFENTVITEMKKMYPNSFAQVANSRFDLNDEKASETLNLMKKGVPLIFQAVLIDKASGLWGIADILIRSDYINKIWKNQLDCDQVCISALQKEYHYRVIDIKWTTLQLCADGKLIRNSERIPAYKGQLAIYNYILGRMQGYYPSIAYVMGHAWKYEKCGEKFYGDSCFERLGEICYEGFDNEYISRTVEGIRWIRNVRKYGKYWNLLEPCNENLYPNMSNQNDMPWSHVKKQISKSTKELTELWMVGYKNRKIGHANGIYKWNDKRCKSSVLGINGPKISKTLDKIIEINNNIKGLKILPKKIENNDMNWQLESKYDMFVDFETLNECFIKEPTQTYGKNKSNIIFMIGCGYSEDGVYKFKQFTMKFISLEEEMRIIDEWHDFMTSYIVKIKLKNQQDKKKKIMPRFFHWSNAEVTSMNAANERHQYRWNNWLKNIIWVDLCKIFTDEPIVVNGAFKFKLKDIAKNMYKHGFIKTTWDEIGESNSSVISDGLSAMIEAINYYKENEHYDDKDLTDDKVNDNQIDSIRRYNEIDCKVMLEIAQYLRENHT